MKNIYDIKPFGRAIIFAHVKHICHQLQIRRAELAHLQLPAATT